MRGLFSRLLALLALVSAVPAAAQVAAPRPADPYMFATNRLRVITGSTVTDGTPGNRMSSLSGAGLTYANIQHVAIKLRLLSPPYAISSMRFVWPAFLATAVGEARFGNPIYIDAAYVRVGGTLCQLTFGGSTSAIVPDGGYLINDPNACGAAASTSYTVEYAYHSATGDRVPSAVRLDPTLGDGYCQGATTQLTCITGNSFTAALSRPIQYGGWGPVAMVAKGWKAAVTAWASAGRNPATYPAVPLSIGDSISCCLAHDALGYTPNGVTGYVVSAFDDAAASTRYPYAQMAVPSTKLANLRSTPGDFAIRAAMLQDLDYPFTTLVTEMGINSLTFDTAAFKADFDSAMTFLRTIARAKPIVQTTITVTDSDSTNAPYTSYAGQTVSNATTTARSFINPYILNKPANVDRVVDVRSAVEDVFGNPGKWIVSTFSSTLQAATAAGATSISLDASPPIGSFLVIGSGTATKEIRGVYGVTGNGPYTVALGPISFAGTIALANAHAQGDLVQITPTADGLHPGPYATTLLSQPVIAAKNAGAFVGAER